MINHKFPRKALYCIVSAALISGCSSSDSDSESGLATSIVDLSFSDAAVEEASEVVITVDKIIFRPAGSDDDSGEIEESDDDSSDEEADESVDEQSGGDIIIDRFNGDMGSDSEAADQSGTDTYTIDLLTVQGNDSRLVLDDVQLPVGEYSNMILEVLDQDIEQSYVTDATGVKRLKVPSQSLKLGGFTITPNSKQSMVVEFGLQQSMTYNPGPDRYILKPRGVRIVSVDEASNINGTIDHSALHALEQCEATDQGGTAGNIYVYEGHGLDAIALADNFDASLSNQQTSSIAPLASASMDAESYVLSYLEPGNYTLAVSCHAQIDDADVLDNIETPNPADQLIEVSLSAGDSLTCSVPLGDSGCTLPQPQ